MTWNYRVFKSNGVYGIHKVCYSEENIVTYTEESCAPVGETLEELARDIVKMNAALYKPTIDYETGEEIIDELIQDQ